MLIVETNKAVLTNPEAILKKIAKFWDAISFGWQKVWGPHIHHGYYENIFNKDNNNSISDVVAQEKLIDKIIALLKLEPGLKILDVGCGLGGSSMYLAKHHQAKVVGISLSLKQIEMAKKVAEQEGINNVNFLLENAHCLTEFENESFDLVWSLESCEQFYDKALFLDQAYRVLKPGGKLMLATWCADKDSYSGSLAKRYVKLCKAFDLPYMPTQHYYHNLLQEKFILQESQDWSEIVKYSWQKGINKLKQFSWIKLLSVVGLQGLRFAGNLQRMSDAFIEGQIRYGVFIAQKPRK